jgi:sarcosine oxidase subunit gamma
VSETLSHISPFALSDGTDGPEFTNEFHTATVSEVNVPSLICLAGKPLDEKLPAANNILQVDDSRKILGLTPDQWLISDVHVSPGELLSEVKARYRGKTVVCADHSQAWSVLRISGSAAARCLSRLCPVDLHPRVFGENQLIQTNMAGTYILCIQTEGQDNSYDLYMSHSFSRSFFEILRDAAELG